MKDEYEVWTGRKFRCNNLYHYHILGKSIKVKYVKVLLSILAKNIVFFPKQLRSSHCLCWWLEHDLAVRQFGRNVGTVAPRGGAAGCTERWIFFLFSEARLEGHIRQHELLQHAQLVSVSPIGCVVKRVHIHFHIHIIYHSIPGWFNPLPSGKGCVHDEIALWNVSTHRWLYQYLATKKSISRLYDLNWFYLSLNLWEMPFFTNAINTDTALS